MARKVEGVGGGSLLGKVLAGRPELMFQQTMRYKNLARLMIAALLLMMVAACDNKDDKETKVEPTEVPTVSIKVQFITLQMQLAGVYGALHEGYFDDEKLDVELLVSENVDNAETLFNINRVVAGEAQFGLTSADHILYAHERGLDVVAIMTIYQQDPTAVISLTAKNITRPEDLIGKKIMIFNRATSMTLFLNTVGIDPSELTIVEPPDGNINVGVANFITGQVDAMVATGTDASAQMTAIGIEHNIFFLNEYGVQMYPNVIFTTRQMIEENPEVVQRFINAFLRGTEYALQQPETVATWFVENYGQSLREDQQESQDEAMLAIIPLMQTSGSPAGTMKADVWKYIDDGMVSAGLLDESVDPETVYTSQFVDAYYANQAD